MVRSRYEKDRDDRWDKQRENRASEAARDRARAKIETERFATNPNYRGWVTGTDSAAIPDDPPPKLILPDEPKPKARLIGLGTKKDREKGIVITKIRDQLDECFNSVERLRSDRDKTFLQYLYFLQKYFKKVNPKLDKIDKSEVSFIISMLQFSIGFAKHGEVAEAEQTFADLRHSFGMLKRKCG